MDIQTEIILDKLRPLRENGLPGLYEDHEYSELVMSFGIDESEWHQLKEAYSSYLNRGKEYLKKGDLDEAINILGKAVLIKPNDLEGLSAISEAYLQRWQQSADGHDSDRAKMFVSRCLKINPDHEASLTRYAVLYPKVNIANVQRSRATIIIAVAVALIFMIAGFVFFLVQQGGGDIPSGGSHFH